jgi:quinol monooxygenase YgiN
MFALVVRFDVLPDHIEAFDALVAETVAEITELESKTAVYVAHLRSDHLTERVFYECYADEDAFAVHEGHYHTRRFLDQRGQHLARSPDVWRLNTIVGVIGGNQVENGFRSQG